MIHDRETRNRLQKARMDRRRAARVPDRNGDLISILPGCPHGTRTGYAGYACRSEICVADNKPGCAQAWRDYLAVYEGRADALPAAA